MIEICQAKSSNVINSARYDYDKKHLYLTYKRNTTYRYSNIPEYVYADIRKAAINGDNVGKIITGVVKKKINGQNLYPCVLMTENEIPRPNVSANLDRCPEINRKLFVAMHKDKPGKIIQRTAILTPIVIFDRNHLDEKFAFHNQQGEVTATYYSTTIVFPEECHDFTKLLEDTIYNTYLQGCERGVFTGVRFENVITPLRSVAISDKLNERYPRCMYMNVSSDSQPVIYNKDLQMIDAKGIDSEVFLGRLSMVFVHHNIPNPQKRTPDHIISAKLRKIVVLNTNPDYVRLASFRNEFDDFELDRK